MTVRRNAVWTLTCGAICAGLIGCGHSSSDSNESSPSGQGTIAAEVSTSNDELLLFAALPDGSHGRVFLPTGIEAAGDPTWSPDGSWLAFTGAPSSDDVHTHIYTVDSNGSNLRQITSADADDGMPTWSPDGKELAFTRYEDEQDADIYGVRLDGSNERLITGGPGEQVAPAWAPDGIRIAFVSFKSVDGSNADIATVSTNISGSVHVLVSGLFASGQAAALPTFAAPAWAPNGQSIAYVNEGTMWTVDTQGGSRHVLARGNGISSPAWSPDGRKLVFVSDNAEGVPRLFTMTSSGTGRALLSTSRVKVDDPADAEYLRPTWGAN